MPAITLTIPGKPFGDTEQWLPVPGYPGIYDASSFGRVMSLPRLVHHKRGHIQNAPSVILSQSIGSHGYPTVTLSSGGIVKKRTVHSVIAETFIGPRPQGFETRHLDGNRQNCRAINLVYGSHEQNQADRITHGTDVRGQNNPMSKLRADQVQSIRAQAASGAELHGLARDHCVAWATVSDIVHRRTWSHIA